MNPLSQSDGSQQSSQQHSVSVVPPHQQHHLMGLMASNPALAAAAAATPLFPPAAMLSNPAAFLSMPEAFCAGAAAGAMHLHNAQHLTQQQQASSVGPQTMPNAHSVAAVNGVGHLYPNLGAAGVGVGVMGPPSMSMSVSVTDSNGPNLAPLNNPFVNSMAFPIPSGVRRGNNNNNNNNDSVSTLVDNTNHLNGYGGVAGAISGDNNGLGDLQLTPEERAKQNRDRNREHARSTRLRKKAYVSKLKELVEGLHAERTEEVRQRRVAIQHLAEMQKVRRSVVRTFLQYHASFETDERKWTTLLETDKFWLKQPITPYRSFRSSEIEKDYHICRGVESLVCDAASLSVMIESTGSRTSRWLKMKREEFLLLEEATRGSKKMPPCTVRQDSRLRHAISSLSSSSGSSNLGGSSGEELRLQPLKKMSNRGMPMLSGGPTGHGSPKPSASSYAASDNNNKSSCAKVSSSGSSSQESSQASNKGGGKAQVVVDASKDVYHDYHAKPLPDPKLADSERSSCSAEDSPEESASSSNLNGENDTKRISTDSSSGDDNSASADPGPQKRRKTSSSSNIANNNNNNNGGGICNMPHPVTAGDAASIKATHSNAGGGSSSTSSKGFHPPKIAKKGGISHNIRIFSATPSSQPLPPPPPPVTASAVAVANGNNRLSLAPAVPLPPFCGIGKKRGISNLSGSNVVVGAAVPAATTALPTGLATVPIGAGVVVPTTSSSSVAASSSSAAVANNNMEAIVSASAAETSSTIGSLPAAITKQLPKIHARYHINEDDMILMDSVLMCPFTFRTQDAVLCGALAECVMPGMLRANFSDRNKLQSLELVYDAMGFMQQLERASGNEGAAQIIPGSLELALTPTSTDARVITTAKAPYLIVNVNDIWTQLTGYTQMEVEGREYLSLLDGEGTVQQAYERPGKPRFNLGDIANGRSACMTNIHYDKDGNDFVEFVCSYPLANGNGEVTHLLHVSKELPSFHGMMEATMM